MGNDADLFANSDDTDKSSMRLYEAKMAHLYNHRWANLSGDRGEPNCADPNDLAKSRLYVSRPEVRRRLGSEKLYLTGVRDVTNATNERTLIPFVLPPEGVGHNITLFEVERDDLVLVACMSSLVCDFIARVKLGGTHMSAFVLRQLPIPEPAFLDAPPPWDGRTSLRDWVVARAVELTYTAWDLEGFAVAWGHPGAPFRWIPARRQQLLAELDAAFLHVYGLDWDQAEFVLEDFRITKRQEERDLGEFRTRRLVLGSFDRILDASQNGQSYVSPLTPPPGSGPRHPSRA
jgi:hypothetical protein